MEKKLPDEQEKGKHNMKSEDSPSGMSLQKESEWKVKVRDWWYSIQDAQKCPDEIKRVEIEHIIREALSNRENEIAEEVENYQEYGFCCGSCKTRILGKVLSIIKH